MLLVPIILAATIAGLLLAPFYVIPQVLTVCLLAVCTAVGLVLRSRPGFPVVVFLFFFLLANLRYIPAFPDTDSMDRLTADGRKLTVSAVLEQVTQRAGGRSQLDMRLLEVVDQGSVLVWSGDCRVRIYLETAAHGLFPGDLLRFKTRLRRPRLFGTPGEFHWPRYLAAQGIGLTGWVKSVEQFGVTDRQPSLFRRPVSVWKEKTAKRIGAQLDASAAYLLRALLLGEAKLLPDRTRKVLARTGTSHLFAISGLHLGLIGLFGYRLLLRFYRRSGWLLNRQPPQRILPLMILPLLFGYLLLTGDAVSTRRAFCVACAGAGFWWWRYTVNPLRLLQTLALLFLLFNPLLLWQASWQLSFAGAAGILLWRPFWQSFPARLPRLLQRPVQLLLVTTAATVATLPLVLFNFHLLATAGLLANLIAVPVVSLLALPIGLLGLLTVWIAPVAAFCFACSAWMLEVLLLLLEKLHELPGLAAHYLFLSRGEYWSIALLLVPLLVLPQFFDKVRVFRLTVVCLAMALLCSAAAGRTENGTVLHMFSVGQGDSMLLTDGNKQAVLIDGGGLYSDRFDVGERLLAPALGELGVQKLSAVLLSHDHPDHRKGLIFILKHFAVEQFWTAEAVSNLHPTLQQVLQVQDIPVQHFPSGWSRVEGWNDGQLSLYHAPTAANKNDSSLVLYLNNSAGGLLLTGDLEKQGVRQLLQAGIPGPVSLLKLPHHGSRHSASDRLISCVSPEHCLVSAGFRNRYGFPARQVTEFLNRKQLPLHRTDLHGTIRARISNGHWELDYWRKGLFR